MKVVVFDFLSGASNRSRLWTPLSESEATFSRSLFAEVFGTLQSKPGCYAPELSSQR